jgi:UDP-N-acetyl-D-mannosaminuronic acid dehydrogenase
LQPGPGVGGHCIAVDPWFIISRNPDESRLIYTARQVNDYKPQWVIEKVKLAVTEFLSKNQNKTIKDVTIACFGLAFKPNIDDLRESPALEITSTLANLGICKILAVEPNVSELPPFISNSIELVSISKAISESDICVLLVDHCEFKQLSEDDLKNNLIIDTKGIWV